jgi:hypothetical protein
MVALETSLHHAALVVLSSLHIFRWPVFIAQMHFNARNVIAEVAQAMFDDAANVSGQRFIACNVVVGIDLDLHAVLLVLVMGSRPVGWR